MDAIQLDKENAVTSTHYFRPKAPSLAQAQQKESYHENGCVRNGGQARPGQASCKPAGPDRLGTLKSFNNLGTCCSKTLLRYVALGFAESDLWYLLHGCYRKGTLEKNAEAFRLGRAMDLAG